jgi:hypothetical protein
MRVILLWQYTESTLIAAMRMGHGQGRSGDQELRAESDHLNQPNAVIEAGKSQLAEQLFQALAASHAPDPDSIAPTEILRTIDTYNPCNMPEYLRVSCLYIVLLMHTLNCK